MTRDSKTHGEALSEAATRAAHAVKRIEESDARANAKPLATVESLMAQYGFCNWQAREVIEQRDVVLAERTAQGLAMMAQIETLTRQLTEARNGLTICADMAQRALRERERGASITVEAVSDIWRAGMIAKHRSSDDFKG